MVGLSSWRLADRVEPSLVKVGSAGRLRGSFGGGELLLTLFEVSESCAGVLLTRVFFGGESFKEILGVGVITGARDGSGEELMTVGRSLVEGARPTLSVGSTLIVGWIEGLSLLVVGS